jgi:hypothetical protein
MTTTPSSQPIAPEPLSASIRRNLFIVYLAYALVCIGVEAVARSRFHVGTALKTQAVAGDREGLRQQVEDQKAREAMANWPPYSIYVAAVFVLAAVGAIVGCWLAIKRSWRHVVNIPLFGRKLGAIAFLVGLLGGFFVPLLPYVAAGLLYDSGLLGT